MANTNKTVVVLASLVALLAVPFAACRSEPMPEVDPAHIERVVREYYDAFNAYDTAAVETVYARQAWKEEGVEISTWVRIADSMDYRYEFIALESIRTDNDSVSATVIVESPMGSGQDFIDLAWERGGWKVFRLLTRKPGEIISIDQSSGSCCSP